MVGLGNRSPAAHTIQQRPGLPGQRRPPGVLGPGGVPPQWSRPDRLLGPLCGPGEGGWLRPTRAGGRRRRPPGGHQRPGAGPRQPRLCRQGPGPAQSRLLHPGAACRLEQPSRGPLRRLLRGPDHHRSRRPRPSPIPCLHRARQQRRLPQRGPRSRAAPWASTGRIPRPPGGADQAATGNHRRDSRLRCQTQLDAFGSRKYPHAVHPPDRRSLRARVDADERRRWLLRCKVDQKTVAASCLAFAA
jgi:hypothetical protein